MPVPAGRCGFAGAAPIWDATQDSKLQDPDEQVACRSGMDADASFANRALMLSTLNSVWQSPLSHATAE
jgi:hypothetical protein